MKIKTLLTLAASATFICTAVLQAFEGKMDLKITNTARGPEARSVTLYAKNELLRAEYTPAAGPRGREMGPMVSIIDRSKHTASTLIVNKKVYITHPLKGDVAEKVAEDFSGAEYKATGRTETIAGVSADEYVATLENGKYNELWVSKALGKFLLHNEGMGDVQYTGGLIGQAAWSKFAYSQNFFVLRAIERDSKTGPETFHLEVTKLDRSSQPDSLFTIPSDYKKVEPRDLMRE